jgi:phosphohistidine phosphatase SixA
MKIIFFFLFFLFILSPAGDGQRLFAQSGEITVILFRHAERQDNSPDSELSVQGRERAVRLVETIRKYCPEYIFSSAFKRTRATVTPLAENLLERYRMQIQLYDHTNLKELADKISTLKGRTVVVAGHNTTTPALANLFIKEQKYKPLQESEYGKIWIIKIKKNKVKDTVIEY